jgi:hypothetical protein
MCSSALPTNPNTLTVFLSPFHPHPPSTARLCRRIHSLLHRHTKPATNLSRTLPTSHAGPASFMTKMRLFINRYLTVGLAKFCTFMFSRRGPKEVLGGTMNSGSAPYGRLEPHTKTSRNGDLTRTRGLGTLR